MNKVGIQDFQGRYIPLLKRTSLSFRSLDVGTSIPVLPLVDAVIKTIGNT